MAPKSFPIELLSKNRQFFKMASQIDSVDSLIDFNTAVDCSYYSPIQSEVAVSLRDLEDDPSLTITTAHDVSVYSVLESVIGVSMEDITKAKELADVVAATQPVPDECTTTSTVHYAYVSDSSDAQPDLWTAWEDSDPSCYTPARNTCTVEFSENFCPALLVVSLESMLLTAHDASVYEVLDSKVEIEPSLNLQLTADVRVSDSHAEVCERDTIKLTPILPDSTDFAWDDVKTDVSERSVAPSEIEVEFEAWNEWRRGFTVGNSTPSHQQ